MYALLARYLSHYATSTPPLSLYLSIYLVPASRVFFVNIYDENTPQPAIVSPSPLPNSDFMTNLHKKKVLEAIVKDRLSRRFLSASLTATHARNEAIVAGYEPLTFNGTFTFLARWATRALALPLHWTKCFFNFSEASENNCTCLTEILIL